MARVVSRSPAARVASAARASTVVLPPRLPVSPATSPASRTELTAAWSPWLMTRSVASHTPLIPAQRSKPCSSASQRACSAKRRVSADSPRSQWPVARKASAKARLNGWPIVLGQVDGPDQLVEAAVEVAEEEMAPAGEHVGGHALVGPERGGPAPGGGRGGRAASACSASASDSVRPALPGAGQAELDLAQHLEHVVLVVPGDGQYPLGELGARGRSPPG